MNNVKNNQEIGRYLEKLIYENFDSRRKFCIKVLDVQFNAKPSEEQIANYSNKISQIIKGRKVYKLLICLSMLICLMCLVMKY